MRARFQTALAAAAVLAVGAAPAAARQDGASGVTVGEEVRGSDGSTLGRIEQVVSDPQGRPQQVLVRTRGLGGVASQMKSLPISTLRAAPGGYVVALRKSEFELLPAVKNRPIPGA